MSSQKEAGLIAKLKQKQLDYAVAAVKTPTGRDGYAYGRVAGIYEGLQMAIDEVLQQLKEEADADKDL